MTDGKQLTPIGQICKSIEAMDKSLSDDLVGTGVDVKRFIATAKTAVQTHVQKDRLAKADRNSLFLSIKRAATDGLMPDNREAALAIYGDQVQYQPMVQGLVKLARQSGEIESIGAYIVYSGDKFKFRAGVDKLPEHEAEDWFADRGEPIGCWAFVKLKTGEALDPVMMTKERIMRIAKRSKIADNYNPDKGLDWEEWWKKAAIRNILKYAPKSTQLERALAAEDGEFDNADIYLNTEPEKQEEPKERKTRAAAKIIEEKEPEIIDAEIVEDPDYEEEVPM